MNTTTTLKKSKTKANEYDVYTTDGVCVGSVKKDRYRTPYVVTDAGYTYTAGYSERTVWNSTYKGREQFVHARTRTQAVEWLLDTVARDRKKAEAAKPAFVAAPLSAYEETLAWARS